MSTAEPVSLSQMSTVQFLSYLHSEDIELWPEGDRLRFSAPAGGLRPELRAELARRKEEVLELLRRSALTSGPAIPSIAPIPRTGPLPLSFAQERLWFLDQYEPWSATYTLSPAFRLRGALRVDVLARSLAEILRRHEVLRATFSMVEGRPVQEIAPHPELPLPVVDLRQLPEEEREARAERLGQDMASEPFDLARGPLLRTCLLRLGEEEWLFLLTVHHIVFDGWSSGILTRELLALYAAFAAGRPSPLPDLPAQYVDFAAWQRQWLTGERVDAELAHWRRRLAGAARLELPTDRPRSAQTGFRGAALPVRLDGDLSAALRSFGQGEDATPFMVLLAGFQALLSLYSGQDDISVGSVVAGRTRREVEDLIGFFINTLVLRTDLSGLPGFRQLLARARSVAVDAFAHQDLPFERLVEELQPERRAHENPLFQVMLVLQNAPASAVELPGLHLSVLERRSDTAKFDLTLALTEGLAGLAGSLEYNTDLFDRATAARLARHLEALLRGVVADPDRPLPEVAWMSGPERHQVLREWNAGLSFPASRPLHELFAAQAARTPEAVAVSYEGIEVSYADLRRAAVRLARRLVDLGVGPEAPVGLCAERGPGLVAGLLGILMVGGAYVPLDPNYPEERLALVLEDVKPAVVVADSQLLPRLPGVERTLVLDDAFDAAEPGTAPAVAVSPDQVAYVIYTSGSTGRPKGTPVTHRNVARLFTATAEWFGFGAGDVWTLFHSFAFDFSVWEIWGALLHGGRLVVVPHLVSRSPESFYRLLCREGVTVLNQTPSAFRQLVRAEQELGGPDPDLALRWVIFGGEALDLGSLAPWLAAHGDRRPRLINMYGITETTVHVSFRPVEAADLAESHRSPIGVPIPDLSVHVLDAWGQPVPAGVHGEIHVGGAGLGRGYLGRPDLTAERFVPDPFSSVPGSRLYRSGDLARRAARGEIEYLGRIDHQIKIRGYRVEPGEVEAAVAACPGVAECSVVVRDYGADDRRLVACVVPGAADRDAPDRLLTRLREMLRRELPEHMVPAHYILLDALPLTSSGKVDRRALQALEEARPAAPQELSDLYQEPVEELLARIWEEVLRVERVGRDDNFFDLGGHSLLATQVMSRVQAAFQVELPVVRLFEAPTVAGLARAVQDSLRATPGMELPPILPAPRDRPLPLSFSQKRLWVLHQFDPESPTYNLPAAVRLTGEVDVRLLEAAFEDLARRHEVLRTTFTAPDGQPVQIIAGDLPVPLPVADLRGLPPARREEEARRLALEEARRPFDLTVGPLLRTTLLRLDSRESWALVTMHHIVSDGWSMGLFLNELGALYQAAQRREPAPLPELEIQYADFAWWQNRWMTGEVLRAELAWWKERLAGAPTNLPLPTDKPRPAVLGSRGGSRSVVFSRSLDLDLVALGRRQGATLFMTSLAGISVLLGRYADQNDLLLGSPIAGRNRREIEGLIGFFVNTLVLRSDLSGKPTFEELLGRVRRMALDAYAHQDLPFERLVEELVPERDLSRTPLFQVMFVLQNTAAAALELPDLVLEPMVADSGTAKFDLLLSLSEAPQGLLGVLEYNLDLFDSATMDRLIVHFGELLAAAARNPATRISDLPLLNENERYQLLVEWNATAAEFGDACLHELVEMQVDRNPDAVALLCEGNSLTYGELERRANRVANRLRSLGVGLESVVGLCGERSLELVIGMLGILKAGAAYMPLDPDYPRERLAFLLEDARPPVALVPAYLEDRLPEMPGTRREPLGPAGGQDGWSDARPASGARPESAVYVIYTSGSTGRPKGVLNSHRGICNRLRWIQQDYPMGPRECLLQKTPYSFDVSVGELFWPLVTGARLVLAKPGGHLDNGYLTRTCIVDEITHVHFVPLMLQLFLEENGLNECRSLRHVMCSGEALPVEPVRHFFQQLDDPLRVRLVNLYGPTEAAVEVTGWRCLPADGERASIPIGRPIANTQIRILDPEGYPSPTGVPGELNIGGVNLARGYLDRPALTAEKFVPDPYGVVPGARLYRTGDLARVLPGGEIEFMGRVDHQIKIRGLRIEPGEIEAVLVRHPDVDEAAVVVERASGGMSARLISFFTSGRDEISTRDLDEFLRDQLPAYMVPSAFVRLERLPMNANGKLDRRALAAYEVKWETEESFVAPRNRTELELQRIWEKVLQVRPISVTDNFFQIGGHSLLGIYIMVCIRERLGRELPVLALFRTPTIEGLAAVLEHDLQPPRYPSLVLLEPGAGKRPFFCVHGAGGNVFYFTRLAQRMAQLDPERPFYGLQAPGLNVGQEPLTSIGEMAALYVEAIRSVQPEGPYLLGGYSMGGMVALEMARLLREDGQEVDLLALFDTLSDLSEQLANRTRAEVLEYFGGELSIPVSADELQGLDPDAQLARVLEKGWEMKRVPREFTLADAERYFRVLEATVDASRSFAPEATFPGRIVLFRSQEMAARGAKIGWTAEGGVETFLVPGDHRTMFEPPHVEVLGDFLKAGLDRAEGGAAAVEPVRSEPVRSEAARPPAPPEPAQPTRRTRRNMVGLDLRWALRNMRRNLGLTAVIVLSLALAIGGNTAIFSFVNGILLRPLAVRDLHEVVRVRENWAPPDQEPVRRGVNALTYQVLRQENKVFDGISAAHYMPLTLTGQGEPEEFAAAEVSADFFSTLGVEPVRGRAFLPEEEKRGRAKTVVIGEGVWERRFGSDPQLVGKSLLLNGEPHQVVGIIPRRLKHPYAAEMWVPMVLDQESAERMGNTLYVPARLKPGMTVERAEVDLSELIARLAREGDIPEGPQGAKLVGLREELMRDIDTLLYLLFAGAAFVLLIACANVSNLLLAQSLRQSSEAAVRVALGAGGGRLVRQFLTQSLLLALFGGGLGLLLAWWSLDPIVAFSPAADVGLAELGTEVRLDAPTLLFTFAVTAFVGLILGLVPAFNAFRLSPQSALRQAGRSGSLSRGGRLYLSALVVSEVALAVLLLLAAGVVAQSFTRLNRTDWGFKTDHLLAVELHFQDARYPEAAQRHRFVREAVERIRALPGVVSVGGSSMQPFTGGVHYVNFDLPDQPAPDPPGYYSAHLRAITPDYLRTMGIPLLQGRYFVEHDGPQPREGEAIVSRSFAERFWPGQSALGKRFRVDQFEDSPWLTIVGVARDLPLEAADAYLNLNDVTITCYVPYTIPRYTFLHLMVRTSGPPEEVTAGVRSALREVDKDQAIADISTMERHIDEYMSRDRFSAFLFGSFGVIGLALALIGIYAVTSFFVTQQNRELGIRVALGAQPVQIRNLVLRQAAVLTGLGLLAGGLAAFALKRFAASLIYGIVPGDLTPIVSVLVVLAVGIVAFLACYLPARRATRVDPMLVLHGS